MHVRMIVIKSPRHCHDWNDPPPPPQVPLQSDIIIDTPAQAVPNVDGSGDLEVAQLRQQMEQEAILLREVHQRAMKEQDAQHQRAVREQDGQHQRAMREQDAQHQRAMREQDAQHQNAYAVLREKMNEQLGAERRGRKVAEEERDGLVERFHSLKDASESEVSSLKYQLSSQLVALEQSKEVCVYCSSVLAHNAHVALFLLFYPLH